MTRKHWRVKLYPAFRIEHQQSRKKAYERVASLRNLYAEGMAGIHQVDVEVDEGDGWMLYERCEFPEREAAP